uniref:CRISPR-associated helicase Cas3 n=1 Tax=Dictyoglomus thermophilum TaxID=14 RepID=A0A7C3MR81_DICTH
MNSAYEVYAKSYYEDGILKTETLKEHTFSLINNYEILKERYGTEINKKLVERYDPEVFWDLLRIAAIYHDLGKLNSLFQNKIRRLIGQEELLSEFEKEIPHNYLSPALLPKRYKEIYGIDNFFMLIFSIIYHHHREMNFDKKYLEEYLSKEILNKLDLIKWINELDPNFNENNVLGNKYTVLLLRDSGKLKSIENKLEFILLKGLLYRLDHSSSAHVEVEKERIDNVEDKLVYYITYVKKSNLKGFQRKAKDLRDKSVLLTAPTGIGKTEFAINWMGETKSLYSLPLRVSVNAMYERFKNIFGEENIGILHGDIIYYDIDNLENLEREIKEHLYRISLSRQMSYPIIICTADQIFTSFFRFPGYEKVFSIFPYAKIIVDEPQAYTSESLAVIVEGLKKIHEMGGRFCLMSATVYPILEVIFKDIAENIKVKDTDNKNHKIKYYPEHAIEDLVNEIVFEFSKGKKVLVIVNTVKKAQQLYFSLKGQINDKSNRVNLMHSRFIGIDRMNKEHKIFLDEKSSEPCIWITTQIVEASLDIDFDILFTELAPVDALIQRMGRIYRKRKYLSDDPNIIISGSSNKPSGKGAIYDSKLVDETYNIFFDFDNKLINYDDKNYMVEHVYSMEILKNSNYYKKFLDYKRIMDIDYKVETRGEAEKIFRKISNVRAIPVEIYDRNREKLVEIRDMIYSKNIVKKLKGLRELQNYVVDIPLQVEMCSRNIFTTGEIEGLDLYIINLKYDKELGLIPEKELENII